MTKPNDSRARRTVLATVAATVALVGTFGAPVHADDEPEAEPAVETGQTDDGAAVAVGPPPVPPTSVVVAVGQPPVPPTSVVVAVGQPPVPPVAIPPAITPAVTTPAVTPPAVTPPAVEAPRAHGLRQVPSVEDRLGDALADVIAKIEAALALINGQI